MKKSIFSNIPLKILSLGIAITLWILIRGEQRTDMLLDVKVELRNIPKNLVISNQNSERISVRLNGPKAMISRIDEKYFKPYLCDLADANPGEFVCKVLPTSFKIEKGMQINNISPREIKLELETVERKEIPVEPGFIGKLESGFEIESYDIYPDNVIAAGPKSAMVELKILKTVPINLVGRRKSFVEKFPLVLPGKNMYIEGDTEFVLVNLKVREEMITRLIKDVALKVTGEGPGVRIEPKVINVKIVGPAGKIDEIKREDIDASVDLDKADIAKLAAGEKSEIKVTVGEIPGMNISNIIPVYLIKR